MNLYDKILKFQLEIRDLNKRGASKIGDKSVPYWLLSDIFIKLKELCEIHKVVITHEDDSDKEFVVNRLEKQVEIIYWKQYTLVDLDRKEGTEHCNILTFPSLACGTNTNISRAKGSAETYAYRYFLMNLLLLSEDELDPDHDVNHTYSNPITAQAYKPHREPKQVSNIIQPPKVINDNTNWTKSKWIPTSAQVDTFEYTLLNYPSFANEFINDHMERLNPKTNLDFLISMGREWFNEIIDRRICLVKKIEWTKKGMEERQAISLQKWKDKQEKE